MCASSFDDTLRGITAAGSGAVWAVGSYDVQTPTGTASYDLIEHWNGIRWSTQSSPDPTGDDILQGVDAVSAGDVWAVGSGAGRAPRVQQWNGRQWTSINAPLVRKALNLAFAVSAPAAGDVWLSGEYISLSNYSDHTLTEHLCKG